MKNISLIFLAVFGLFGFSAQAQQQGWPNWYVGVHSRLSFVEDSDLSGGGLNGTAEYDTGLGAGASLGYMPGGTGFFSNTRYEIEYSLVQADLDTVAGTPTGDDLRVHSYMFNGFYDIPTGTQFVPYVGAGIGFASPKIDIQSIGLRDEDTVFAYQFMGGIGYQPTSVPNTTISLGYRYFGAEDPEYTIGNATVSSELSSHNIEVGARFAF